MDKGVGAEWLLRASDLPDAMHQFAEIPINWLYYCMCLRSCIGIRQADGARRDSKLFSVSNPLASCIGSMLVCMGGGICISLFLGGTFKSFVSDMSPLYGISCWYVGG